MLYKLYEIPNWLLYARDEAIGRHIFQVPVQIANKFHVFSSGLTETEREVCLGF
jgi:hypothetical protein